MKNIKIKSFIYEMDCITDCKHSHEKGNHHISASNSMKNNKRNHVTSERKKVILFTTKHRHMLQLTTICRQNISPIIPDTQKIPASTPLNANMRCVQKLLVYSALGNNIAGVSNATKTRIFNCGDISFSLCSFFTTLVHRLKVFEI